MAGLSSADPPRTACSYLSAFSRTLGKMVRSQIPMPRHTHDERAHSQGRCVFPSDKAGHFTTLLVRIPGSGPGHGPNGATFVPLSLISAKGVTIFFVVLLSWLSVVPIG